MAQNKEQLNKLLLFIKRLIDEPGNEDFVNKLRKMLGTTPSSGFDTNPLLADIEKYLGLDYQIDSTCPIIDYSFIDDEFIRNQLISDLSTQYYPDRFINDNNKTINGVNS